MSALTARLLNDFQRGFPLDGQPYAQLAERCGVGQEQVLAELARARTLGLIARVGAVFAPGRIGASTLAALAVPACALAEVAQRIGALPGINHSYEREHAFNLWIVATAADRPALGSLLARVARLADRAVLDLPLVREYRIDLGFDLGRAPTIGAAFEARTVPAQPRVLSEPQRRLVAALQDGLALVPDPYRTLAAQAGLGTEQVCAQLARWCVDGTIRRFGVIVRHRELGYRANAMAVWDVPDAEVDELGAALARQPGVTLAYRRRRAAPDWPYNLFCMIHARARETAREHLAAIGRDLGLVPYPAAVLFSRRRFKQTAARYVATVPESADG